MQTILSKNNIKKDRKDILENKRQVLYSELIAKLNNFDRQKKELLKSYTHDVLEIDNELKQIKHKNNKV